MKITNFAIDDLPVDVRPSLDSIKAKRDKENKALRRLCVLSLQTECIVTGGQFVEEDGTDPYWHVTQAPGDRHASVVVAIPVWLFDVIVRARIFWRQVIR